MSQLMLQAPGSQNAGTGTWQDIRFSAAAPSSRTPSATTASKGSAIIDAAPGNLNGEIATPFKLQASLENVQEFRVESNSYPAEFGTGSRRAGERRHQVRAPTRFTDRSFDYIRNDALDAPQLLRSPHGRELSAKSPSRSSSSISSAARSAARSSKDRAFFFGSYEGYQPECRHQLRRGACRAPPAWARAVPAIAPLRPGFLAPTAVILPGKSIEPRLRHRAASEPAGGDGDTRSASRLDFAHVHRTGRRYVRVFHDQATSDAARGRQRPQVVIITDEPDERDLQPAGHAVGRTMRTSSSSATTPAPTTSSGQAPVDQRHRLQQPSSST